jgi:hypothetical protein
MTALVHVMNWKRWKNIGKISFADFETAGELNIVQKSP